MLGLCVSLYSRGSTEYRDPYRIMSIAFSPGGKQVVTGHDRGGIKTWNLDGADSQHLLKAYAQQTTQYSTVELLAYSPDSRFIASMGQDFAMTVWDSGSGKEILTLQRAEGQRRISPYDILWWSGDGRQILYAGGGMLITWDAADGRVLSVLSGGEYGTFFGTTMAVSPNGKFLARGSIIAMQNEYDRDILLWNLETNEKAGTIPAFSRGVYSMDFSSDGGYFLAASLSEGILLWDIDSREEVYRLDALDLRSAAFSPEGSSFMTVFPDRIEIRKTGTGELIQTLATPQNRYQSKKAVYSPEGRFIVLGNNHNLIIWDTLTGEHTELPAEGTNGADNNAIHPSVPCG